MLNSMSGGGIFMQSSSRRLNYRIVQVLASIIFIFLLYKTFSKVPSLAASSRRTPDKVKAITKSSFENSSTSAIEPTPSSQSIPLRYAYINGMWWLFAHVSGHHGTSNDFQFVSSHLGIKVAEFNPRLTNEWGPNQDKTNSLLDHKLGDFFCTAFDVVIVGDTNTDARFLLQRIDYDPEEGLRTDGKAKCGIQRVIMLTTNRFDFGLSGEDKESFYRLVRKVSRRRDKKIVWVANNPWEIRFMELVMKVPKPLLPSYTLIRPMGYSALPQAAPITKEEAALPVMFDHPFIGKYWDVINAANISVKKLGWQYGGPSKLKQYRVIIDLPYQTSTMKWYENLAAGAVSLVPSPRFLKEEIIKLPGLNFVNIMATFDIGDDWYKYIEFYGDDLGEFFYQFDSLDDLKEILARDVIDTRNVRERAPQKWKEIQAQGLADWKALLFLAM